MRLNKFGAFKTELYSMDKPSYVIVAFFSRIAFLFLLVRISSEIFLTKNVTSK